MRDATPTILHKGQPREIVIGNAAMMRFRRLGGSLEKLEANPIDEAVTLACAALDLPGDPIDHADDFPPVPKFAEALVEAVRIYMGEADAPGEPGGDAPSLTPASPTD